MLPAERTLLIDGLRDLADRSFQERVWVRDAGPEVSSFTELVCQIFDDTGLEDLLESGGAGHELGAEAARELGTLSELIDAIPEGLDVVTLLRLPVWSDVMRTAARAADLVAAGSASVALTPLEDAVIATLLAGDHPVLASLRAQLDQLDVTARTNSGVGFFVDFAPRSGIVAAPVNRLHISDVEATIGGLAHGAGFVLFVDRGIITMLEGFSYDEPWPDRVGEFSLRYGDPVREKLIAALATTES
jgi:hypothetical protein